MSDAGPATACKPGSGRRRLAQQWLHADQEPGCTAAAVHRTGTRRARSCRRRTSRGPGGGSASDGGSGAAGAEPTAAHRSGTGRRNSGCAGGDAARMRAPAPAGGAAAVGHEGFFYFSKNNLSCATSAGHTANFASTSLFLRAAFFLPCAKICTRQTLYRVSDIRHAAKAVFADV